MTNRNQKPKPARADEVMALLKQPAGATQADARAMLSMARGSFFDCIVWLTTQAGAHKHLVHGARARYFASQQQCAAWLQALAHSGQIDSPSRSLRAHLFALTKRPNGVCIAQASHLLQKPRNSVSGTLAKLHSQGHITRAQLPAMSIQWFATQQQADAWCRNPQQWTAPRQPRQPTPPKSKRAILASIHDEIGIGATKRQQALWSNQHGQRATAPKLASDQQVDYSRARITIAPPPIDRWAPRPGEPVHEGTGFMADWLAKRTAKPARCRPPSSAA